MITEQRHFMMSLFESIYDNYSKVLEKALTLFRNREMISLTNREDNMMSIKTWILETFFKTEMQKNSSTEYNRGVEAARHSNRASRSIIRMLETPVGSLQIAQNSNDPMDIVEITGFSDNGDIPLGRSILTGKEFILFCSLFDYSPEMVVALSKLEAHERNMIRYNRKPSDARISVENEIDADAMIAIANAWLENVKDA